MMLVLYLILDINGNTQHSVSSNRLQGPLASNKMCVENYEGVTTHTPISSNSLQTLLFLHVVVNLLKKTYKNVSCWVV